FLLAHARRLLVEKVSHRMLVALTSPLQLLRELFTVKGAGTLVKRGSTITRGEGYVAIDTARLRDLLESSFGRAPAEDFFARPITRVFLEESYRGAALILETPLGAYLSKFAVEREAQGEGIGRDLWQVVVAEYPAIFWRARPSNPIAPWYTQECDGMARFPEWHVFWRGMPTERIEECIRWALQQPADFGWRDGRCRAVESTSQRATYCVPRTPKNSCYAKKHEHILCTRTGREAAADSVGFLSA